MVPTYADFRIAGSGVLIKDSPVRFYDKSRGEYISFKWDFGDGNTDIVNLSPTHTYTEYGTYTVSLTLYTEDGINALKEQSIVISEDVAYTITQPQAYDKYIARGSVLLVLTSVYTILDYTKIKLYLKISGVFELIYDGGNENLESAYTSDYGIIYRRGGTTELSFKYVPSNIINTAIELIFSVDSDGIAVPERTSHKWDMFRWSNGVRWWV